MNWLKKLMLFKLLMLVILLKKTDCDTKIGEVDRKIPPNHDIYIITQELKEFT